MLRYVTRALAIFVVFAIVSCGSSSNDSGEGSVFNSRLTPVTQWNELMLDAIRTGVVRPTVITRQMFIVSVAMYDAWSAYDSIATPYYLDPSFKKGSEQHSEANRLAAVSQAAYYTLVDQFPAYESRTGNFLRYLQMLGFEALADESGGSPESIGYLAAVAAIQSRSSDGSNAANDYADTTSSVFPSLYRSVNSADPTASNSIGGMDFDPNRWTPIRVPNGTLINAETGLPEVDDQDPSTFSDQTFLTPHWGAVTPFALSSASQFRPPAPPQFGSSASYTDALGNTMTSDEAWNRQFDQVLMASANLDDRDKVIAEFWADGPRSEAPPGHWNQLAHGISSRDTHSVGDDVKMFFALNAALLDAGIATWEAKRIYDFIRPVSAIRFKYAGIQVEAWGGPDQGTVELDGSQWRPYQALTFVTPPFAEFVSGHSTFSRAAAEVLTAFTGSGQFYDGVTRSVEDVDGDGAVDFLGEHIQRQGGNLFENSPSTDVVLRWATFRDAADEAGISRIYGGIHVQDGDLRGRELGRRVGLLAFAKAEQYWSGVAQR